MNLLKNDYLSNLRVSNRSSPSVPVAVSEIQNHKQKNLRGGTHATRLVISRGAQRFQKTKKLVLKVVGTGLGNGFCDFQLFWTPGFPEGSLVIALVCGQSVGLSLNISETVHWFFLIWVYPKGSLVIALVRVCVSVCVSVRL